MAATGVRADAQRNREHVLAAALEALTADPDASMAGIAAASGLARMTVYRHFSSRDQLIAALFDRVSMEAEAAVREIAAMELSSAEFLREMASTVIALGVRYQFLEQHQELVGARLRGRTTGQALQAWAERAQRAGELRRGLTPEWLCRAAVALLVAAAQDVADEVHTAEEAGEQLGDTFVAAFLRGDG